MSLFCHSVVHQTQFHFRVEENILRIQLADDDSPGVQIAHPLRHLASDADAQMYADFLLPDVNVFVERDTFLYAAKHQGQHYVRLDSNMSDIKRLYLRFIFSVDTRRFVVMSDVDDNTFGLFAPSYFVRAHRENDLTISLFVLHRQTVLHITRCCLDDSRIRLNETIT